MRHDGIDVRTALGVRALQDRLEQECKRVRLSILHETMDLLTWNMREFGKLNFMQKSLLRTAEVIGNFSRFMLT